MTLKKITDWFERVTPYWVAHGLVAVAISLVTGYWAAGSIFYLGRELRDWEKLHQWDIKGFDWKGLLAPIVTSIILYYLGDSA